KRIWACSGSRGRWRLAAGFWKVSTWLVHRLRLCVAKSFATAFRLIKFAFMQKSARQVFAIVIFCFFISGMAGLIYQLAWMLYLALFLGHTSYAVVAVLVAFMGGLAIGNAAFGVWAVKTSKPLAVYGWRELGMRVYALL